MNPATKLAIYVLGPSSLSGLMQNADSYVGDVKDSISSLLF